MFAIQIRVRRGWAFQSGRVTLNMAGNKGILCRVIQVMGCGEAEPKRFILNIYSEGHTTACRVLHSIICICI